MEIKNKMNPRFHNNQINSLSFTLSVIGWCLTKKTLLKTQPRTSMFRSPIWWWAGLSLLKKCSVAIVLLLKVTANINRKTAL